MLSGAPGSWVAYAARADDYARLFGSIEATAAEDRALVARWGAGVDGPILDVGCGPGHWSGFLAALGHEVEGLDPVAEFVTIARRAHPGLSFEVGSAGALDGRGRYGGLLCWYSLIHLDPPELVGHLRVFRELLVPGGRLLVGFFDGDQLAPFDHAVARAYFWPSHEMARRLERAGFEVDHVELRRDEGARPHAAIAATRSADPHPA